MRCTPSSPPLKRKRFGGLSNSFVLLSPRIMPTVRSQQRLSGGLGRDTARTSAISSSGRLGFESFWAEEGGIEATVNKFR
ncbi:exported protein of unknown function [Candidatus Methylomirabilis oxygeniifera]|uniref:Uncharacterized protein n=1 Tax=Methylomirabilis oxygeniifera TaxID=671143 RepID=D5MHI7_METO1|nr:exported protein of unknown function [Candidatus Methylomirabilis oxyfera]